MPTTLPLNVKVSPYDMVNALDSTETLSDAALLCNCSPSSITAVAKKSDAVATAIYTQSTRRDQIYGEAIKRNKGILSRAADDLGLPSVRSLSGHIARSDYLRDLMREQRFRIIDTAEANVFHDIEEGGLKSSWKMLITLGKDRGYTERREIDSAVTHSISTQSTSHLRSRLSSLQSEHPELVEAQFSELSPSDLNLLAIDEMAPSDA